MIRAMLVGLPLLLSGSSVHFNGSVLVARSLFTDLEDYVTATLESSYRICSYLR